MKPDPNYNPPDQKIIKEDFEYVYFKDTEGRLKRLRKKDYKPRTGYVRFKFIEKVYFWWKKKSFDYRNAIMTIFMGQNELEREIKARLPFDYENSQIDEMKKLHKEELKKQGKMSLL